LGKRDFTRHYDFSEKQSRVNVTRKSFVTRVTPEKLLVMHDISSTTATFSSLDWKLLGENADKVCFLHDNVKVLIWNYWELKISWGISFYTNASTSVAVTNGTSFSFLRHAVI